MALTASSYNRSNKFHVCAPCQLCVSVREKAVFSLSRQVLLLVPTCSLSQPQPAPAVISPDSRACIDAQQLLDSCYTEDENNVIIPIPCKPLKIISITAGNISVKSKLATGCPNHRALATVNYTYNITVKYIDVYNKAHTIIQKSCNRRQKAFLKNAAGHLEVILDLRCTCAKTCPPPRNENKVLSGSSAYLPTRLWVKPS